MPPTRRWLIRIPKDIRSNILRNKSYLQNGYQCQMGVLKLLEYGKHEYKIHLPCPTFTFHMYIKDRLQP